MMFMLEMMIDCYVQEAAYSSEQNIPKVFLSHLKKVEMEEKDYPLTAMETEYADLKKKYQMLLNQVDDVYGDVINLMNQKPQRYFFY